MPTAARVRQPSSFQPGSGATRVAAARRPQTRRPDQENCARNCVRTHRCWHTLTDGKLRNPNTYWRWRMAGGRSQPGALADCATPRSTKYCGTFCGRMPLALCPCRQRYTPEGKLCPKTLARPGNCQTLAQNRGGPGKIPAGSAALAPTGTCYTRPRATCDSS